MIEAAVGDFRGYDPAVKTLAKVYRLWLDQAVACRPSRGRLAPDGALVQTVLAWQERSGPARALGRRVLR